MDAKKPGPSHEREPRRRRGALLVRRAATAALLVAGWSACGETPAPAANEGGAARPGSRRKLAVAAASDLRFVLPELEAVFERERPEIDLTTSFGSSGGFYAQLVKEAPFDLFLSADEDYPRRLAEAGAAETPFPYAVGRLALLVRKDSPLDLEARGMEALRDPSVRKIAIANPAHAPYGRAAEGALAAFGADAALRAKLVLGDNVAQAAQFVETGAAEIGLVAKSLAASPAMRERCRFVVLPTDLAPGLRQAGAVMRNAANAGDALRFVAFLRSPAGRAIFAQGGFQAAE
jgi:molybdate transport system substrate-binding protein